MDITASLFVVGGLALALLTIWLVGRFRPASAKNDRFASIDGLRGYLGFFVFLHHAAIWPAYVKTGVWAEPAGIFNHFGQASVLLFFMITGFLFTGKLLRADIREIDWLALFLGRLLRLGPLYAASMVVLAILVVCSSGLALHQEPLQLIQHALQWMTFAITGAPDLNGVQSTFLMMSGVVWTLPYEWLFYLSLPLLGLLLGRRTPLVVIMICSLLAGGILLYNHRPMCALPFISGMVAARLVQSAGFLKFSASKAATFIIVACLAIIVLGFHRSYGLVPIFLVSVAFSLIAGGNSLFGVLTAATSRLLGECAFGLYLLHGFVLYVAYRFVIGFSIAADFSPAHYATVTLASTPVLVLLAYAAFVFIEAPAMRMAGPVTTRLRRQFARKH
jgi:peptidoglycan/LPS O-acetylase OafA/YrhL